MAQQSAIEWTDATWNPIAGCSVVSPGCTNCYAMKMAARVEAMAAANGRTSPYDGLTAPSKAGAVWNGQLRLVEGALSAPIGWRKPRRIFVNSMSDLFHDDVPDAWIDKIVAVMHLTPQHTYQVLTKRAARQRTYFEGLVADLEERLWATGMYEFMNRPALPLPNVHLGVSVEDQVRADERIPELLATPAAVRWISAEPLLGPIDLTRIQAPRHVPEDHDLDWKFNALVAGDYYEFQDSQGIWEGGDGPYRVALDGVVVGGESGPKARPIHPDWVRIIRDDCANSEAAFFFKRWGEWAPGEANSLRKTLAVDGAHWFDDRWDFVRITEAEGRELHADDEPVVWRVGKRHSGRLLDGFEHNDLPAVAHA
ncbi:phage Gp37/Gp68 family protein [Caulobacter sp. CCNWLY153]|uniref:DUF5131 family protein n=1 Tax=unclassified Caulobacter TaxID=2648921 RepID=UPI002FF30E34